MIRQLYERYIHLCGNVLLDLCPLFFFAFEDGCRVAGDVFDSVEGDIATGVIRGVRACAWHLEVALGRVLKWRRGLALRGNGRHECKKVKGCGVAGRKPEHVL
jgi:hypothetical protein